MPGASFRRVLSPPLDEGPFTSSPPPRRLGYADSVAAVRPWALASGIVGLVTLAAYVALILGQGDTVWQAAQWGAVMLVASIAALIGSLTPRPRTASIALGASTLVFAFLTWRSALTIGALFLVAAVTAGVAFVNTRREESEPVS